MSRRVDLEKIVVEFTGPLFDTEFTEDAQRARSRNGLLRELCGTSVPSVSK